MTDASEVHQGGCFCGAVRYTLRGAPDWSGHCHCRSCQKATGAAFTTWVGLKKENFEVTKGQLTVCNTSPGVERGFCGQCGTSPRQHSCDSAASVGGPAFFNSIGRLPSDAVQYDRSWSSACGSAGHDPF